MTPAIVGTFLTGRPGGGGGGGGGSGGRRAGGRLRMRWRVKGGVMDDSARRSQDGLSEICGPRDAAGSWEGAGPELSPQGLCGLCFS